MAVTAKFVGDFSSFQDAVGKAEASLRDFASGADKVQTSLDKVSNTLSGRKVAQEAEVAVKAVQEIGGVTRLTAKEQEDLNGKLTEALAKYKALGIEPPADMVKLANETKKVSTSIDAVKSTVSELAGAFGIVFSVASIVDFGKELFALADNIVKLSDKTGLTVEQVQRLSYVAGQSGNSVEQLTDSVSKLQVNLSNPKAQEAIRDLGVNFQRLKAASPYEQLQLIADAIAKIADPAKQAEYAVALFGKTGTEILPTLKSQFSELAKEVTVASDNEVRALDAAGDALQRLASNTKAHAVNILGSFVLAGEGAQNVGLLKVLAAFVADGGPATLETLAAVAAGAKQTGHDINLALPVDSAEEYRKKLDEIANSVDTLSSKDKALIDRAVELNQSHSDIASNLNLAVEAVDTYIEKQKEATDQRIFVAKLADEWHQLYVDMHLTGVKMLNEYTKEVQAAMAKQREVVQAAQLEILGLVVEQRKQLDTINGTALTGVDAQMAALQKKYDADIQNIEQLGRAATTAGVGGPEWAAKAQEASDNAYRIYVDGFNKIVAASNQTFGTDVPAAMAGASEAASKSASGINGPFTLAFQSVEQAADAMAAHVASVLGAMTQTDAYRKAGFFVNPGFGTAEEINRRAASSVGFTLPGFANGVSNYKGGPAIVGERGPELVNLPRGSSVTPNGGWGGVTVQPGAIVINGHGPEAGRDAADALLARLKSRGVRV